MSNIHPIFAEALAPFAPPERLAMRAYMVRVIDRKSGVVREQFEAMAPDSVTCVQQHLSHALEGEKLDVMALDAFRAQPAEPFSEEWRTGSDKQCEQRKDTDAARTERESDLHWRDRNVRDFTSS